MHVTVAAATARTHGLRHPPRALHPADITRRHGIPVTSAARTLLDLAATEPPAEVDRALNEARIAPTRLRPFPQ